MSEHVKGRPKLKYIAYLGRMGTNAVKNIKNNTRPPPHESDNKLKEFTQTDKFKKVCSEVLQELLSNNQECESEIVDNEEKIVEFSDKGYECQPLGNGKWLMRKKLMSRIEK